MFRLLYIFVIVPVLWAGTVYGNQQDSILKINIVSGVVRDTFDYCEVGEKAITIELSVGNVTFADSLMFFEIQMPIDTSKLRYVGQVIFTSTLAGATSLQSANYDPISNSIFIEAGNTNLSLLAGNLPLVRIRLISKVTCEDSIPFTAKAFFNSEFKKGIMPPLSFNKELSGSNQIVARPIFKASRFLSTTIDGVDTVQIDSVKTTKIPITIASGPETNVDSIRVYLSIRNNENISIPSYEITCGDFKLTEVDSFNWFFDYKTSTPNGVLLQTEVVVKTIGTAVDSFDVFLWSKSLTSCDCITFNSMTSTKITHGYKDVMSSVYDNENNEIVIKEANEIIELHSRSNKKIQKVTIYSLLGEKMFESSYESNNVIFSKSVLPNGLYLLQIKYDNKTEINLKYIFNN